MYTILLIDEDKKFFRAFHHYVKSHITEKKLEFKTLYPAESLEEMIEEIISYNPDAIISDFILDDIKSDIINYEVLYDGVDIINSFLEIREGFPCFVITSYDEDAMDQIDDVNKIYIKEVIYNPAIESEAQVNFLQRIEKQIKNYKARIEDAENRLQELLDLKNNGKVTLQQEEELERLDSFLEKSIDKKRALPQNLKKNTNEEKLQELLDKTNLLLNKLGSRND